jgi:hypothetical protein
MAREESDYHIIISTQHASGEVIWLKKTYGCAGNCHVIKIKSLIQRALF